MKKILYFCFILSSSVFADSGVYINVNAGANTNVPQIAYNANAGYMFNRYLGLEGGYTEANSNYWDAAVKGVLPIPFIDVYGKLGMSYVANQGYSSGAVMYGVGVAIPIFPMFQVNVEDYAISDASTQNFLMAGLQFKF